MTEKRRFEIYILAAIAALLICMAASLAIGRYSISLANVIKILVAKIFPITQTWKDMDVAVVISFRLPRTLAAVVVGGALAISGTTYQSIFKNPMASPDLLGVSSGACVGAATAILLGAGSLVIQVAAFAGGILAVVITTTIPKLIHSQSTTILILAGVVVGSLMSSIISIIKTVADTDTQLAEITYWMMGSFADVDMKILVSSLPLILIPVVFIVLMSFRLNVLSLGDAEAQMLGINLARTRGIFILFSTLITAACVSLCGTVGWVGLIIPHVSRMVIGADNKKSIPLSLLFGGIFMLIIDILCRTLSSAELKLGILTGIIGAPFFIFILIKQHKNLT